MKKAFLYLLLLIPLIFISCSGVFIPDPIDPRLPVYTQKGRNVAGAIINGEVWQGVKSCGFITGCTEELQIFSYARGDVDSVQLILTGQLENSTVRVPIRFILHKSLEGTEGVAALKGIYQLNSTSSKGFMDDCLAQDGRLEIKHVEIERNEASEWITMAGTFSLSIEDAQCGQALVEWGRFDYSVSSIEQR